MPLQSVSSHCTDAGRYCRHPDRIGAIKLEAAPRYHLQRFASRCTGLQRQITHLHSEPSGARVGRDRPGFRSFICFDSPRVAAMCRDLAHIDQFASEFAALFNGIALCIALARFIAREYDAMTNVAADHTLRRSSCTPHASLKSAPRAPPATHQTAAEKPKVPSSGC